MTNIEKELKNRFENQQLSNDDFDAEGLWSDVTSHLESTKVLAGDAHINESFLGKYAVWLLMIPIFIAGILIGINRIDNSKGVDPHLTSILQATNTTQENEISKSEISDEVLNETEVISSNNTPNLTGEFSNDETALKASLNSVQSSNEFTQKIDNLNQIREGTSRVYSTGSKIVTSSTHIGSSNTLQILNSDKSGSFESIVNKKSKKGTSYGSDESSPILKEQEKIVGQEKMNFLRGNEIENFALLPMINYLDFLDSSQDPKEFRLEMTPELSEEESREDSIVNKRWGIEILSGVNMLFLTHKSSDYLDASTNNNEASTSSIGMSTRVAFLTEFKNDLILKSGIEYHTLWSKFEWSKDSTALRLLENQATIIYIDPSNGDTINVKTGDVWLVDLLNRKVKHHNQFKRISLPIEFGIRKQLGKFDFDVLLGVSFNLTTSQSGKILAKNNDFISFVKDEQYALSNNFDLGLRFQTGMSYHLSDHWSIVLQPNVMLNAAKEIRNTDIKVKNLTVNGNIGLSYNFGKRKETEVLKRAKLRSN